MLPGRTYSRLLAELLFWTFLKPGRFVIWELLWISLYNSSEKPCPQWPNYVTCMLHNFVLKQDCHGRASFVLEFFFKLDLIFSFPLSQYKLLTSTFYLRLEAPLIFFFWVLCFLLCVFLCVVFVWFFFFPPQEAKDAMIKLICIFNLYLEIRARRDWKWMPSK